MIHKKLLDIQKGLRSLTKDAKAYNYNYVSGDKLLSYIRPKMDELGLVLMPEVLGVDTRDITYKQWDKSARAVTDKTEVLYTLRMRMTWIDAEDGETLSQEWAAAGMNAFDKGYGSALTYGERYYLLKLFHVQTDKDDVDAVSAERDEAMDIPVQSYKPMDVNEYWKVVKAEAAGKRSKSGASYRDEFIRRTNAGQAEIARFDCDVEDVRINPNEYEQPRN